MLPHCQSVPLNSLHEISVPPERLWTVTKPNRGDGSELCFLSPCQSTSQILSFLKNWCHSISALGNEPLFGNTKGFSPKSHFRGITSHYVLIHLRTVSVSDIRMNEVKAPFLSQVKNTDTEQHRCVVTVHREVQSVTAGRMGKMGTFHPLITSQQAISHLAPTILFN